MTNLSKSGTTLDSYAKLRENLFDLNNGYYISRNDSLFWRKVLNRQPENGEAMYHVGLEVELEAKKHLNKFYTTKVDMHLIRYRKEIKRAFDLLTRSFNKGFFKARLDVLRVEREIILADLKISSITDNSKLGHKNILLATLFIMALIIAILATFLIAQKGSNITSYTNNNYTYMLPYEVVDKKPTILSGVNYKPIIINVKREASKEVLVNELVDSLKKEYVKDATTPKQIIALDENSEEIGMAIWSGGGNSVKNTMD